LRINEVKIRHVGGDITYIEDLFFVIARLLRSIRLKFLDLSVHVVDLGAHVLDNLALELLVLFLITVAHEEAEEFGVFVEGHIYEKKRLVI
jgi:hypothetical protein